MEATQIHPCNLRTTTPAQRKAIEQTEAAFAKSPAGVTLRATVAGWDGWDRNRDYEEDSETLAVQFIYSYNDDPEGPTGLEVTVFDSEGNIVTSQDFG